MSTRVRASVVATALLVVAGAVLFVRPGSDSSPTAADALLASESFLHTVHLRGYADDTLANTCTGVLVAPEWVLTVKHCWGRADSFTAIVGVADWTTAERDPAAFVYRAEIIERQGRGVDLAMIRLERPVPSAVGTPVPLLADAELPEGTSVLVSGWGERDGGVRPDSLDSFVTTVDADCGRWGDPATDVGFLEAGFQADITICTSPIPKGACTGDSGGPVVVDQLGELMLAGIIAFGSGEGCGADPSLPDGHVAVAPFVDWIERLVQG